MKQALQKSLTWTVVLSETTHVFCCVFPTIFSLISLLAGLGLSVAIPASFVTFHDFMHHWEVPIIVVSGLILALGWAVTLYSDRVDCHHTGCEHGACAPRKNKAHLVLKVATILFLFNVIVYFAVHRTSWFVQNSPLMHEQEHNSALSE